MTRPVTRVAMSSTHMWRRHHPREQLHISSILLAISRSWRRTLGLALLSTLRNAAGRGDVHLSRLPVGPTRDPGGCPGTGRGLPHGTISRHRIRPRLGWWGGNDHHVASRQQVGQSRPHHRRRGVRGGHRVVRDDACLLPIRVQSGPARSSGRHPPLILCCDPWVADPDGAAAGHRVASRALAGDRVAPCVSVLAVHTGRAPATSAGTSMLAVHTGRAPATSAGSPPVPG
jgi:hypothetical protein